MPGFDPHTRPGVFQGLVLEPSGIESEAVTDEQERFTAATDEVNHRLVVNDVTVEPHAPIHRVDHPFTPARERSDQLRQEQAATPSLVAFPTGVAEPKKR